RIIPFGEIQPAKHRTITDGMIRYFSGIGSLRSPRGDTSILYSVKIILYLSKLNHPLGRILIENN
ncbi:hypothetical protein, partial [Asaccharospora irregularis]